MRRFVFLFVVLFSLLLSLPAFSQTKRPFTFEDMMKLKRVGEPVPSPDGRWVLFSAVDVDLAANKKTPHIWIVPLNSGVTGASPVPVTAAGGVARRSTDTLKASHRIAHTGFRVLASIRRVPFATYGSGWNGPQ